MSPCLIVFCVLAVVCAISSLVTFKLISLALDDMEESIEEVYGHLAEFENNLEDLSSRLELMRIKEELKNKENGI